MSCVQEVVTKRSLAYRTPCLHARARQGHPPSYRPPRPGSGLGIYGWVVEHAFALLHWFRRLRIRWERRDNIHEAFVRIGCSVVCWRRLKNNSLCRS